MDIAGYLKASGLTQVEFANKLGVTQSTVGFWLHNKPPTIERAIQIEKLTNGAVRCEDLRPDVDWAYLRGTNCPADQRDPTKDIPHVMPAKRVSNGHKEAA